ncbi:MAG: ABC-F type ribosomal protection protein [Defluviitaleaceae bacterium]|nr:ABC-F type ribosomal protection protein [Defluviitaleaceae bacterium]
MSQIKVTNLTFSYEGDWREIFTNANFQIDTDWKLGFCGRNGRGKTTFLNLLMGKYEYSGTILADTAFEYFPFTVDISQNTVDIFGKIAPSAQLWQLQKELSKLDMPEDVLYRPFATLSEGERTKAMLAGLFLRENNFLLIDEPTNHLDRNARKTVARYLNTKTGFILVSHDRAFLDGCIDHVLSINRANIEVTKGNFTAWFKRKKEQDLSELAQNRKLKKDITRLEESAARAANWSDKVEKSKVGAYDKGHVGHMAAKMMKRAKNTENLRNKAVEEKSKLLKNIEAANTELKIHSLKYHSRRLLALEDVSVFYDGVCVCKNVNFSVEQGERLAIVGGNGTGKSSLLKLLCNEKPATMRHTGEILIGGGLKISYVQQNTANLTGKLADYISHFALNEPLFKAILRKLDFSRDQFDKPIEEYSAGQKKKLMIANSLTTQAHLYIWDEPLNYIDVLSRIQIEELIKNYQPTMIFVEHDADFCENTATKILELW